MNNVASFSMLNVKQTSIPFKLNVVISFWYHPSNLKRGQKTSKWMTDHSKSVVGKKVYFCHQLIFFETLA